MAFKRCDICGYIVGYYEDLSKTKKCPCCGAKVETPTTAPAPAQEKAKAPVEKNVATSKPEPSHTGTQLSSEDVSRIVASVLGTKSESSDHIPNSNKYFAHRRVIGKMSKCIAEYVVKCFAELNWKDKSVGERDSLTFAVRAEQTYILIQFQTNYKNHPLRYSTNWLKYSSFGMGNVFDTYPLLEALRVCLKSDFSSAVAQNLQFPGVRYSTFAEIAEASVWSDSDYGYKQIKQIELTLSYRVRANPNLTAW